MNAAIRSIIVASIIFGTANCATSNVCRRHLFYLLLQQGVERVTAWVAKEAERSDSDTNRDGEVVISTNTAKWHIENASQGDLAVRFFSGGEVWPSMQTAYIQKRGRTDEYTLACRANEQVCFGAWQRSEPEVSWGAGYDGKQKCTYCCVRCGGPSQPTIRIVE